MISEEPKSLSIIYSTTLHIHFIGMYVITPLFLNMTIFYVSTFLGIWWVVLKNKKLHKILSVIFSFWKWLDALMITVNVYGYKWLLKNANNKKVGKFLNGTYKKNVLGKTPPILPVFTSLFIPVSKTWKRVLSFGFVRALVKKTLFWKCWKKCICINAATRNICKSRYFFGLLASPCLWNSDEK